MADQIHRLILAWILTLYSLSAGADMVETIARLKSSVVIVGTYQKANGPQMKLRGTGFVVGDGLTVATNAHVIGDMGEAGEAATLVVQLPATAPGQRVREARIWVLDKAHDLVLLKIDGPALPPVTLRDSDTVKEGLSVAFTGFPIGGALGFSPVTHRGMVSDVIRRLKSGSFDIFQLDATAYPGNSGGPLFDAETGEVVGIINMVLVKATKEAVLSHPSGISYAIPANYLRNLLTSSK
jgi:S1-C subfamily serine protease